MMKKLTQPLILSQCILWAVVGCSSVRNITDTITLYPDNAAAKQWGVINIYRQQRTDKPNNQILVDLPNGKQLQGQLTYLENSGNVVSNDDFWDHMSFGFGQSFGNHHGGMFGISVSPRSGEYRSNVATVGLNAFGENLGMNCQGEFNRQQQQGLLNCQLTNGMKYRGTLRRISVAVE